MFHQPRYADSTLASPPVPAPLPPAPPLDLSRVQPLHHPAAYEYDSFLNQLTFNSKDVITSLTRIAGENMSAADAIVAVIEQRSFHAPPHAKLPFLYLVDSIVKNIGAKYVPSFAINLFHTFTGAYAVAPPAVRMSMHRLLNTWPPIFGLEIVTAMRRTAADHDSLPVPQPSLPVQQPPIPHSLRMPPQQHAYGYSNPNIVTRQPPPRVPPSQPRPIPAQIAPPVSQSQLPLHSDPSMPTPLPAQMQPMERQVPPSHFLEVQRMMQDITRKANVGIPPSSHQLFTINRLITTQLQSSPLPYQRDTLLRFQHQLREISSMPRQNVVPPPPPPPPQPQSSYSSSTSLPCTVPPHASVPLAVSSAINGLFRSMPRGLLNATQPAQAAPPTSHIPRHPSLYSRAAPTPTPAVLRMGAPIPRGPPPSVPVFKASAPIPLKFADLKTISHAAAVRSLYTELPHLSKSDGMRFSTKEALREHLDWLFRQNRRKRARSQSVVVGGTSRCWYEPLSVFLGKEESSSGKRGSDKKSVGSVNANETVYRTSSNGNASDRDAKESNSMNDAIESKGDNEVCQACNESFESYWDDDKHAWMLKEATRTDDGEVFHPRCVELTEVTEEVESEDGNEIEGRVVKEEVQEAGSGVNKRKREATEETAERQANVNEEIEEGKEEKSNKRTKVEKVDSSALTGCDVSSG